MITTAGALIMAHDAAPEHQSTTIPAFAREVIIAQRAFENY